MVSFDRVDYFEIKPALTLAVSSPESDANPCFSIAFQNKLLHCMYFDDTFFFQSLPAGRD